jgi:hypothetical protein
MHVLARYDGKARARYDIEAAFYIDAHRSLQRNQELPIIVAVPVAAGISSNFKAGWHHIPRAHRSRRGNIP